MSDALADQDKLLPAGEGRPFNDLPCYHLAVKALGLCHEAIEIVSSEPRDSETTWRFSLI
jgi:hypothetical protein